MYSLKYILDLFLTLFVIFLNNRLVFSVTSDKVDPYDDETLSKYVDEVLKLLDKDNDGQISYVEYRENTNQS